MTSASQASTSREGRWGIAQHVVRFQEDETCRQRSALVAVDKRMISAKIEQISGGDLNAFSHEGFAAEGCLRRRDRGLEQGCVPQAPAPAVCFDRYLVNRQYG